NSSRRLTEPLKLQVGKARCIAFAPGAKLIAVGGDSKDVVLWDLKTKEKTAVLAGLEQPTAKLAFSNDGKTLAALAADGTSILLWDVARNVTLCRITPVRGAVAAMALSPDGKMLAAAGADDKVYQVWRVAARELTRTAPPLELSAKEVAELWTDLGSSD